MPERPLPRELRVLPLPGLPEIRPGDDLAALVLDRIRALGMALAPGDVLAVSSKVVSKALGLVVAPDAAGVVDRDAAVRSQTRRVVAERRTGDRRSRVVESVAGPVMAAAGVDASNTGADGGLLLLPSEPDAVAVALRSALLRYAALPGDAAVAVVVTDTAGRTWRTGQVDFALGSAGLAPLDDLRGGHDADGRPLEVTARAVADEVAAAADLVKGKADAVPVALLRGLPTEWFARDAEGAGSLVRTGTGDWFALGHVEALRAALGAPPGSPESDAVGVPATTPEPLALRAGRAVALALLGVPDGAADVGASPAATADAEPRGVEVDLSAADDVELGRLLARLEVAARAEDLTMEVLGTEGRSHRVRLSSR